jgi:hypothetical protein
MIGSSTVKVAIPISNKSDLVEIDGAKKISYSLSYSYAEDAITGRSKDYKNENNITKPWTNLQTISNQDTIEIELTASNIPCNKTYVFVWLQDSIGNSVTYVLTAPQFESNNKWKTWWTADAEGPTGTFDITVYKDWMTTANEGTDYKIVINDNTITVRYLNSLDRVKIKPNIIDSVSGLNTLKYDTNEAISNNTDKEIWLNGAQNATHTITATDKLGNSTTWTLSIVKVTNLNASINHVSGFASGIPGVSSVFTTNESADVSRFSPSFNAPALLNSFADTVTDLTPVTNTKKLRRTRKSSKKSEVKSENVVIEKPVQVIQSVITAAEELSETAHNQHTQASDDSGDAVAELTDVTSVSAVSVESVIKSIAEIAENIGETSDDSADEMSTSEILVNQQILPQGEELVQSHSNYYEDEVVDLKLIYVVIAILLAVVAVVAVIVITKKQKVQK